MGRECKEGSGTIWPEKRGCIQLSEDRKLKQKLPTPASRDNGIKTDVVVFRY